MAAFCFHDSQLDQALDAWCDRNLTGDADMTPEQAKHLVRSFLNSPEMAKSRIADKGESKA